MVYGPGSCLETRVQEGSIVSRRPAGYKNYRHEFGEISFQRWRLPRSFGCTGKSASRKRVEMRAVARVLTSSRNFLPIYGEMSVSSERTAWQNASKSEQVAAITVSLISALGKKIL